MRDDVYYLKQILKALTDGVPVSGGGGGVYVLPFFISSAFSPSDSSTIYASFTTLAGSTYDGHKIAIPVSGRIVRFDAKVNVGGTLGSGEAVAHSLRINDSVDVGPLNFAYTDVHASGSLATDYEVTAGDLVSMKIVTPAWATNPTSLRVWGTAVIEV